MNLFSKLQQRAHQNRPIRVGMIGAGKFGTMFLAQAAHIPGVHVVGIADLRPANAVSNLALVGWPEDRYAASSLDHAATNGTTFISDNWQALVSHPTIDIIVECTGDPVAAVAHAVAAFSEGKHVINATVEADAFCGPALAASSPRCRGNLFDGLWRSTGADMRTCRLGPDLWIYSGCGWPRP